jgi:hypothetical protein
MADRTHHETVDSPIADDGPKDSKVSKKYKWLDGQKEAIIAFCSDKHITSAYAVPETSRDEFEELLTSLNKTVRSSPSPFLCSSCFPCPYGCLLSSSFVSPPPFSFLPPIDLVERVLINNKTVRI